MERASRTRFQRVKIRREAKFLEIWASECWKRSGSWSRQSRSGAWYAEWSCGSGSPSQYSKVGAGATPPPGTSCSVFPKDNKSDHFMGPLRSLNAKKWRTEPRVCSEYRERSRCQNARKVGAELDILSGVLAPGAESEVNIRSWDQNQFPLHLLTFPSWLQESGVKVNSRNRGWNQLSPHLLHTQVYILVNLDG